MCAQRSRSRSGSTPRRRLGAECLESRNLLSAGSVTVAAPVAGVLTIVGDANDDAVQVSGSTSDAGTFTIKGLHGTQVNGVANGSVTETGVTAIATSGWLDGKDFFGFSDNNSTGLAGGLSITMGNGNDEVDLGRSYLFGGGDFWGGWGSGGGNATTKIGGDVQVALGNGRDLITANNLAVTTTQGLLVTTGSGNDALFANNVSVTASSTDPITGDQGFGVMMGDGRDLVSLYKVTVNATGTVSGRQGLGVSLGNGNDVVNAYNVNVTVSGTVADLQGFGIMAGDGNDFVGVEDFSVTGGQGFGLSLGNGRDDVYLGGGGGWFGGKSASNVTGEVLVQLGTGKDAVNADNITTGGDFDIEKTTGGGNGARVDLNHVTVGTTATPTNLTVDLSGDTGKDVLSISHTTVSGTTTLTGGSNASNKYTPGKGNSFANPPVVTGF